ncbi:HNH endonuclease [Neobacillus drentensis]|uniref:HNH endonuclease n=1 Tax=Neobacillus drentensis TaxID=220684 RepID=UPI002FFE8A1D
MIKLTRPSRPTKLTDKKVKQFTETFKGNKNSSVWRKDYITQPLLEMSNSKCAFCECYLEEEGKYLQVEHYYPKSIYPDKVVEWGNLLPICGRCNVKKGDHDTGINPIVDPTKNNPLDHFEFSFSEFRIVGKDELGIITEKILDLNDVMGIGMTRFRICQTLVTELQDLIKMLNKYNPVTDGINDKLDIHKKFKNILCSGLPTVNYSAIVATLLMANPYYEEIKQEMMEKVIWNVELDIIEKQIKKSAYRYNSPTIAK